MSRRASQLSLAPLFASALLAASCGPARPGPPPAVQQASSPPAPVAAAPPAPAVPARSEDAPLTRLGRLVEASIAATHAQHILLARRAGKGDAGCYDAGARAEGELDDLVEHQRALFATDPAVLKAWVERQPVDVDPAKHIDPILDSRLDIPERAPVEVIAASLRGRDQAPREHLRALANLWQIVLEVDRDGDLLQQVFDAYLALGLPVYVGQLNLPGSDADFLAMGQALAPKVCPSPYDTAPEAWRISGRKLWNWAERKLHIRDAAVLAREMLAEPSIQAIVPKLRALPPRKIATVGHSFTLELHWSSPATFVQIAGAVLSSESPKVVLRPWAAGGLSASKAEKKYLDEVIAWKPEQVLLVLLTRTDEDHAALARIGKALKAAKIEGYVFDDVMDGVTRERPEVAKKAAEVARKAGLKVIGVKPILDAAPDKGSFLSLDGIHMKEPYHRLMAREWLELLAGARGLRP